MTKRALLYVNIYARQGQEGLGQAIAALHDLDFELITVSPKKSAQLPDLIRQYQKEVDLVIVGGGDGTLNHVVDVLIETGLPLGILPMGTANDLARTLGIPLAITDACEAIANGKIQEIDLGWVNGKHFFNVASIGLSVKITRRLSKGLKRRWGIFAYAITALQTLWQTHPFRAEICVDGDPIQVKTLQIAVGNGRYYGGGMAIAQDARIDDQRLDLYSLEIQRWWQLVPLILRMRRGQQATLPWVRGLSGQTIEVNSREPHDINTDGEITAQTPATFRVLPKALKVIAPT